jgi:D-inositol-3-phosphate glycosyltransferase
MNVYVRELASALARTGETVDVFTRAYEPGLPSVLTVEPGMRVHHVPAGPAAALAREDLPGVVPEFTDRVLDRMTAPDVGEPFEAIHANYWLSGIAGHTIKHTLDLPLICTFHTLDRVKAEAGPEEVEADMPHRRAEAEAAVIGCSDAVLASCTVEADQIASLYPADPARIHVVPLGVDHAFFGPGYRPQARRALGLPADGTLLLFVGRIQPLKGADVALRALADLGDPTARLVIVGGPSGPRGDETYRGLSELAAQLGVADRVTLVPPQPHELLSSWYRAADVCLVPSRSESFGLVALEAAACGTPVVASSVGGLTTLVDHGRTGFLVDGADPAAYAAHVRRIAGDPLLAERLSTASVLAARAYTWRSAAHDLRALYDELVCGRLVEC